MAGVSSVPCWRTEWFTAALKTGKVTTLLESSHLLSELDIFFEEMHEVREFRVMHESYDDSVWLKESDGRLLHFFTLRMGGLNVTKCDSSGEKQSSLIPVAWLLPILADCLGLSLHISLQKWSEFVNQQISKKTEDSTLIPDLPIPFDSHVSLMRLSYQLQSLPESLNSVFVPPIEKEWLVGSMNIDDSDMDVQSQIMMHMSLLIQVYTLFELRRRIFNLILQKQYDCMLCEDEKKKNDDESSETIMINNCFDEIITNFYDDSSEEEYSVVAKQRELKVKSFTVDKRQYYCGKGLTDMRCSKYSIMIDQMKSEISDVFLRFEMNKNKNNKIKEVSIFDPMIMNDDNTSQMCFTKDDSSSSFSSFSSSDILAHLKNLPREIQFDSNKLRFEFWDPEYGRIIRIRPFDSLKYHVHPSVYIDIALGKDGSLREIPKFCFVRKSIRRTPLDQLSNDDDDTEMEYYSSCSDCSRPLMTLEMSQAIISEIKRRNAKSKSERVLNSWKCEPLRNPDECECVECPNSNNEDCECGGDVLKYDWRFFNRLRKECFNHDLYRNKLALVADECGSRCDCSTLTCVNRVCQIHRRRHFLDLLVYPCFDGKGWGVRSRQEIKQGTFVCEYVGELIADELAESRGLVSDSRGVSYIWTEGGLPSIDATHYGNISRFINHSCAPNLFSCQIHGTPDKRALVIGFFAKRDILPGEALSIDYKYSLNSSFPETMIRCLCGSDNCRGRIT